MVKLEYVPTFDDFKTAARLDRKVNLSNRAFHMLMTWLAPITGLIGLGLDAFESFYFPQVRVVNNYPLFNIGLLIVCFSAPFFELGIVYNSFRSMFPAPVKQRRISIGDDGIEVQVPNLSTSKFEWKAFVKSIQNDRCVLLYAGKTRFLLIPTHHLSITERAELNDLIAINVTKRQPC